MVISSNHTFTIHIQEEISARYMQHLIIFEQDVNQTYSNFMPRATFAPQLEKKKKILAG